MSQEKEDLLTAVRARVREPVHPVLPEISRGSPVASAVTTNSSAVGSPATTATARRTSAPSGEPESDPEALYAGIDLGTSRCKICASNGRRANLPSVVGWPKDPVARQFLGKEILFGEEAVRHRLSLELCHPVDGGVIPIEGGEKPVAGRAMSAASAPAAKSRAFEAASELLKQLVGMAQPRPGQKVYAAVATPGQTSSAHREAILEAVQAACNRVHITSQPFAVSYSTQNLHHALVVDIGAGTTDLCRVHGSIPDESDHLTLREAGDQIDRVFFALLRQKYDKAQFSLGQVREYKERFATVSPAAEPIKVSFPVNGQPTTHEITEELRKASRNIVGPIAQAILQLVGSYDPEFQADLKSQIWLAGCGSLIAGLPQAFEEALASLGPGVKVRRVDDPLYAAADGALKLAQTLPARYWEARVS